MREAAGKQHLLGSIQAAKDIASVMDYLLRDK